MENFNYNDKNNMKLNPFYESYNETAFDGDDYYFDEELDNSIVGDVVKKGLDESFSASELNESTYENFAEKDLNGKLPELMFKEKNEEDLKEGNFINNNSIVEKVENNEFNKFNINEDEPKEPNTMNESNINKKDNFEEITTKKKKKKKLTPTEKRLAQMKKLRDEKKQEEKRKQEKMKNKIEQNALKIQEYRKRDEEIAKAHKKKLIDDIVAKFKDEINPEKDVLPILLKYETENKTQENLIESLPKKNNLKSLLQIDNEEELKKVIFYSMYKYHIIDLQNSPTYENELEKFKIDNLPLKVLFNMVLEDFKKICDEKYKDEYAEYLKFAENEKSKSTAKIKTYDEYSDSYNLLLLLQEIIFKTLTDCEMDAGEERDKILKIMRSLKNYKILAKRFKAKVNKKYAGVTHEDKNRKKFIKLKKSVQKNDKYFMDAVLDILNNESFYN